jgi:hypothetical protein
MIGMGRITTILIETTKNEIFSTLHHLRHFVANFTSSSLPLAGCILRYYMRVNNTKNDGSIMPWEVRKVQDSMRCLMISIPRRFARRMKVEKGSLVRIHFDSDEKLGNQLIIERVTFDNDKEGKYTK